MIDQILSQVRISEVWCALGGCELHRGRGRAFWRGGDNPDAVSVNDSKNAFYDHVDGHGGGVLDLVSLVRGGSRQDALKWLADYLGVPLDDKPLSPEDRARWAAERRELERDLPGARYWRRAAVTLSEESLDWEKSRLFDSTDRPADLDAIRNITAMLGRLKALGDTALVAEYRWWCERHPCMAAAMVRWARQREELDAIAVSRFVGLPMSAAHAYLREVRA